MTLPTQPDPTPVLTSEVREDMEASALDSLCRTGACSKAALMITYSFTQSQVDAFGREAMDAARARWERDEGRAA